MVGVDDPPAEHRRYRMGKVRDIRAVEGEGLSTRGPGQRAQHHPARPVRQKLHGDRICLDLPVADGLRHLLPQGPARAGTSAASDGVNRAK